LKLALFTNRFPSRGDTFFARDIRSLQEAGLSVDVFPIYPEDPTLWEWVSEVLDEARFSRDRVHPPTLADVAACLRPSSLRLLPRLAADVGGVLASAARFGLSPLAKSAFVLFWGWAWAARYGTEYDHLFSYWGNYAATCAMVGHRLAGRSIPFSILLHAGVDLYRDPVYLDRKLLYADNIFVVCEFNRQFVQSLFPEIFPQIASKIRLHRLGLDLETFPFRPDERKPATILCVGRFDRIKGFDDVLRAAAALRGRGVSLEVELIGDGAEEGFLRRLVDELGLSGKVRFLGWLPFSRVREAMSRATLLVHPSIGLGDAVPTVIKEAQALGTPVIGTRVAGIPELLDEGRCGFLVPPRDVPALADALEALLSNADLRRCLAEAARRHVERDLDLWANGRALASCLRQTVRHCPES
jgi:colanic acid/amylovoran biosynthesis glycosyltransferase